VIGATSHSLLVSRAVAGEIDEQADINSTRVIQKIIEALELCGASIHV